MVHYIILAAVAVLIAVFLSVRDKKPVSGNAETLIQAPLDRVWHKQTEIQKWKDWNTDIESMKVDGDAGLGTVFVWKTGGLTIKSKITEYAPKQRIAWSGKTFGINAYHVWIFSKDDDKVHVYTEERFSGILAFLFPGAMRRQIYKALDHGVEVLKQESEKGSLN